MVCAEPLRTYLNETGTWPVQSAVGSGVVPWSALTLGIDRWCVFRSAARARRGDLRLSWSRWRGWHDIDLDLVEIHITGSTAVIAGQRIEGTTKSGRSRTVSIDLDTVQILRDHRKRQAEERLRVGSEWRGTDDYVFSTAWGEPIHPDTVSSLMTTLINTHNDQQSDPLPHARLHDLRHVHATTLLLAGVPVHVVAARLGHADPSITLRVYAHVISDQLTEAADIFARAVAATN